MKTNYAFLYCLLIQLLIGRAYSQDYEKTIFYDDTSYFNGDIEAGFFRLEKNTYRLKIKSNDTTILYKEYYIKDNIFRLIVAYECNLDGYRNGSFYSFDTSKLSRTNGYYQNSIMTNGIEISGTDTIGYLQKINDTLIYWRTLEDGVRKEWQTNIRTIRNGFYKEFDLKTGKAVKIGNYLAVRERDIKDPEKYDELLRTYGLDKSFYGIDLEAQIPIGIWKFFDRDGKQIREVNYVWKDVF